MKSGHYCHKDNKPLSVREFLAILHTLPESKLDKPVIMSSDEEGNDMLKLWGVEIESNGQVTLWPAHI